MFIDFQVNFDVHLYQSGSSALFIKKAGACPGGPRGPAPPPLEIEKQEKKSHQSKFSASSPIFFYFFSRKYHFLSYFLTWAPPEKLKSKNKKKGFQILGLPLTNSWTRAWKASIFQSSSNILPLGPSVLF